MTLPPPHNGKGFCFIFPGPSEAYLGPSQKYPILTREMTCLLLTDQGQRKWIKHHPLQNNKISWKDIHDLVSPAQVMCPHQASLSAILMTVYYRSVLTPANLLILNPTLPTGLLLLFQETYEAKNQEIVSMDCPSQGCQSSMSIPVYPDSTSVTHNPFLCFLKGCRGEAGGLVNQDRNGGCHC